jgi:hypothetical protein
MTRAQIKAFIKRRNESEFQTNLQFGLDAHAIGFKVEDLGPAVKESWGFWWDTVYGRLEERHGKLSLKAQASDHMHARTRA